MRIADCWLLLNDSRFCSVEPQSFKGPAWKILSPLMQNKDIGSYLSLFPSGRLDLKQLLQFQCWDHLEKPWQEDKRYLLRKQKIWIS